MMMIIYTHTHTHTRYTSIYHISLSECIRPSMSRCIRIGLRFAWAGLQWGGQGVVIYIHPSIHSYIYMYTNIYMWRGVVSRCWTASSVLFQVNLFLSVFGVGGLRPRLWVLRVSSLVGGCSSSEWVAYYYRIIVKVVKVIKYLGLNFAGDRCCSPSVEHLIITAERTRHAVQNRISNMGGLSPELKLRLGDLHQACCFFRMPDLGSQLPRP